MRWLLCLRARSKPAVHFAAGWKPAPSAILLLTYRLHVGQFCGPITVLGVFADFVWVHFLCCV